jgi:RNA polymerase sigma factor for flagellar operon FliA
MYSNKEKRTRDENIVSYLPMVEKIVSKMGIKNHLMDREDLIQIGMVGLIESLDRFDESKNVSFESYVYRRIRGSVFDALRKEGKISRDRIKKLNNYNDHKEELQQKLLRTPTDEEICDYMGITRKELDDVYMTIHTISNVSLETVMFQNEENDIYLKDMLEDKETSPVIDTMVFDEEKDNLHSAVRTLNEREQMIVQLYYVEELTLKEIAYILDVSIPRVSQLHGKIISKLRMKMM